MDEADFFERCQQLSQECSSSYSAIRIYLMDKPLPADQPPPMEYRELIARSREAVCRYISLSCQQTSPFDKE